MLGGDQDGNVGGSHGGERREEQQGSMFTVPTVRGKSEKGAWPVLDPLATMQRVRSTPFRTCTSLADVRLKKIVRNATAL